MRHIFIIMLFCPIIVYAYKLPEIKVFGDRLDKELKNSFANVEVINKSEIEELSPTNTYDIIDYINGTIVKSIDSKHTNIDFGGFGEKGSLNNVILINGMRLNSSDMSGVNLSTIPVDTIERVEVYHGGNAVLFGDRAVGGIINIITKKPIKSGVNAKADFGSYNYENYYTDVVIGSENISLILNANRNRTDGYRLNSGFDTNTVGGEAAYIGEKLEYNISGSYSDSDYGLPGALSKNDIEQFGRRYSKYLDDGGNDREGYIINRIKYLSPVGDFVVSGNYRKKK